MSSSVSLRSSPSSICLSFIIIITILLEHCSAWPYDYRFVPSWCPGPEWSVLCRGCCEYDVIRCKCPLQGAPVGYAVPCCRNAADECDPCTIHPGCSIFENCKRCNNGTWAPRDDFFLKGQYCAECRPGWSGGDCMTCGGLIHKRQGHLVLESYPNNARCEWTLRVDQPYTIDLRFMMLSLEFDHSCQYDYVEVRDGDSLNSRLIGRYCGNERPPPIRSSGSSLHLLFVSDGYKHFDGFFAIFQESSECISSPCLHDGTCVVDSSRSYHCACLAGYTGKRCEHVLECRRPLIPAHGSMRHLDERVGGHVVFQCDPGFTLKGFRISTCLLDGSWSSPTPQCVHFQNCGVPPKPENGDHFLVYGPNDVLIAIQYFCYKQYKLKGAAQRTCLGNNTWSGTAPTCITEPDVISTADHEENKVQLKPAGADDVGDAKNKTSQEKENESKPEKDIKAQKPTAGKDYDLVLGKDMDKETVSLFVKEKPKAEYKESDSSINTIEKKDPGEDKDGLKLFDKVEHLHIEEKVETPAKDVEYVDIVLIDRMENNQTTEDKTKDDRPERRPQYTISRLTEDRKEENLLNEVDVTQQENNTGYFDSNDIEENVDMLLLKHAEEPPSSTAVQYSTETTTTASRTTERATDKPALQEDPVHVKTADLQQEPTAESPPDAQNEGEVSACPPPPPLYHGFSERVSGVRPETLRFFCNQSYALVGSDRRTCQADGSWSGAQPVCIRACREPKVSVLVRQKVLPPHVPSRKTPVHKFYSSSVSAVFLKDVRATQSPLGLPTLPQGFHHLYTHIEYECVSPYYQHSGSSRRTCLKMGKWSGRHVSCSPVCGKLASFNPQKPEQTQWPWLASIYRRPAGKLKLKEDQAEDQTEDGWQLVCSGALVNQRSVVVAAHCVTELGKSHPLDTHTLRVTLGKHYRSERRHAKGLQTLRVSSIALHPNFDPLVLDSDVAVLKLLDKARIGEHVVPVCLPDPQLTADQGLVTGWSLQPDLTDADGERARVGRVLMGDTVECEQQYASHGLPISVSENMLCGRQAERSNICPADTGGILLSPAGSAHTPQHWTLLGLVSFGFESSVCSPELYTVYTHIANFVSFIEANMT
ncbi:inactive serine protease PAMR1 isoform X2 [Danio aesculapii]|uniref:inactive serine protease PAMR1 isoform X2 n=1 Tax=Danio aesculapii TaxID=1142201 RepID=UPI0024BF4519|nr:inactive serine protease PAMR1 isoform X2 [Danio aesculapii]